MGDINSPEVQAQIAARKQEIELDREPFTALILGVGTYGDPYIDAKGTPRPAYVCRLDYLDPPLIPKPGEVWLVQTIYRNKHIVILCPIKRIA